MHVVCYIAVFQCRAAPRGGGALRDDTKTAMQQTTVLAEVVDQSTSLVRALQEPGGI